MNKQKTPLISIVTVVYNDVKNIEKTINSVINQSYKNSQYIIVDGGSIDGTIDIINNYREFISHFSSEKDKGIYDAMNKGTKKATGDWIIYMNSGDYFCDTEILTKIFIVNRDKLINKSVIYTDVIAELQNKRTRFTVRSLKLIWMGPPSSHQCQFVKMELAKSKPFNLDFKINADYDFIYYIFKKGFEFIYFNDFCIAVCDANEGASKTGNPKFILKENFLVSKQYSNDFQLILLFIINLMKYFYKIINRLR
tara:strand:+ start:1080 stop:1838 length:759 start_codon:yes stop_codon:yes gene_type:complete